jgi:hypothetical protein
MIKGDINIVVADREDITTMAKHPPSTAAKHPSEKGTQRQDCRSQSNHNDKATYNKASAK